MRRSRAPRAVAGNLWRTGVRRVASAALLIAAVACSDNPVGVDIAPPFPGATRYIPLPEYSVWWQDTERCSGKTGDLAGITWWLIRGVESFDVQGTQAVGAWVRATRSIVLVEGSVADPMVVRHEMLHDLLRVTNHPPEYFQVKCAGVVDPGGLP
jgi:hypothetical protein